MKKFFTLFLFVSFIINVQAQCLKPGKVGAVSTADGLSAVVYAYLDVATTGAVSYEVQYKLDTATIWKVGGITTSNRQDSILTLKGLTSCSKYNVRVRRICSTSPTIVTSEWTQESFATAGCPVLCTKVQQLSFFASDSASANGKWSTGGSGKYYVEYKIANDTVRVWSKDSTTQPYITLSKLKKCTPYAVRIITFCNNKPDTSAATKFETACPVVVTCAIPKNLTATVSADTVVTFTWANGTTVATPYVITIVSTTGDFKKQYTATALSLIVKDLPKCKSYTAAVFAQCDATHSSGLSNYVDFSTKGCGTTTTCSKVARLAFTGLDSATAIGQWTPAGSGKYYVEYKISNDPSTVWLKDSSSTTSIKLTKLKKCSGYYARVLSVCNGKLDTSEITKFETTCPKPKCDKPYGIRVKLTSDSIATLYWWINGAKNYVLQYQPLNSSSTTPWINLTGNDSFVVIKGKPCSAYQVRLRADCDSINPEWLYFAYKTTGTCPAPTGCLKPIGLDIKFVTDSAFVFWNYPVPTLVALKYEVQYKATTDANWTIITPNPSNNFVVLKGLANCKSYTVRVRAICSTSPAIVTSEWAEYTFKAGNRCFGADGDVSGFKSTGAVNGGSFTVSPNPGSTDDPEIIFELTSATNVKIKMFNALGSEVITKDLGKLDIGTYYQKVSNAAQLNAGLYFISIQTEGDAPTTARWMKL